jgi:hypothetical protein
MKALVLSLDDMSHQQVLMMQNAMPTNNATLYSYRLHGKEMVMGMSANFRSPQFHVMSMLKIEGALKILKLGYDVLFIDPDIAVLHDPIRYLLWRNVDYVHSVNLLCNM